MCVGGEHGSKGTHTGCCTPLPQASYFASIYCPYANAAAAAAAAAASASGAVARLDSFYIRFCLMFN